MGHSLTAVCIMDDGAGDLSYGETLPKKKGTKAFCAHLSCAVPNTITFDFGTAKVR